MSAQSAAESLILEFVASPQFQTGLHKFMQGGQVSSDNMLGIMRQFVASPVCEAAHRSFWASPQQQGPELQFDDHSNNGENDEPQDAE